MHIGTPTQDEIAVSMSDYTVSDDLNDVTMISFENIPCFSDSFNFASVSSARFSR